MAKRSAAGRNSSKKKVVAGAAGALLASAVTVSVLQARRRRLASPTTGAPATTDTALTVAGSSIARWQTLRPFRPLDYTRATWVDVRRNTPRTLTPLPITKAALATFAALRAAHAFFREQDPAQAQTWLARHYELRVRTRDDATEATPLNLASAELNCWSALQAVAGGAPIHLLHAPLAELDSLLAEDSGASTASATRAEQAAHALRTPGRNEATSHRQADIRERGTNQ